MYYRRRAYDRKRIAVVAAVAAAGVLLTETPLTDQAVPQELAAPTTAVGRSCLIAPRTGHGICTPGRETTIIELDARTGQPVTVNGVPLIMTVDPETGRITSIGASVPAGSAPAIVDGPAHPAGTAPTATTTAGPAGDW